MPGINNVMLLCMYTVCIFHNRKHDCKVSNTKIVLTLNKKTKLNKCERME